MNTNTFKLSKHVTSTIYLLYNIYYYIIVSLFVSGFAKPLPFSRLSGLSDRVNFSLGGISGKSDPSLLGDAPMDPHLKKRNSYLPCIRSFETGDRKRVVYISKVTYLSGSQLFSKMSLTDLPAKLKPIGHYIKTAIEHDKRDPVVAYFCELA